MMQRIRTVLEIICIFFPLIETKSSITSSDPYGTPLFLTPYIENENIDKGKAMAKVPSLIDGEDIVSYSGFLTVNKTYNSNIFFWFFPAEEDPENSPTVLKITGLDRGASFLQGFGPYDIVKGTLKKRDIYWSQQYNVIHMDYPVGDGFSFTENYLGYPEDEDQFGDQFYSAIKQFFGLFPEHRKAEFFIASESFGGNLAVALGYAIHTKNPTAKFKINFKGLAIASIWLDMKYMLQYKDYLYQIGILENRGKHEMEVHEACVDHLINKKAEEAANHCKTLVELVASRLKFVCRGNFLINNCSEDTTSVRSYLSQPNVRKSLHVGRRILSSGVGGSLFFLTRRLKSAAPPLGSLIENYRVLLYNGPLDLFALDRLTMNMVRDLNWKGATTYTKAERTYWIINEAMAGFVKTADNFTEVLVRNAGHFVSLD